MGGSSSWPDRATRNLVTAQTPVGAIKDSIGAEPELLRRESKAQLACLPPSCRNVRQLTLRAE